MQKYVCVGHTISKANYLQYKYADRLIRSTLHRLLIENTKHNKLINEKSVKLISLYTVMTG